MRWMRASESCVKTSSVETATTIDSSLPNALRT